VGLADWLRRRERGRDPAPDERSETAAQDDADEGWRDDEVDADDEDRDDPTVYPLW